jgi:hypothetical protein
LIQLWIVSDTAQQSRKLFKTTVQQGRSERKAEAYTEYVEALSEARTKLAVVFNSLQNAQNELIARP